MDASAEPSVKVNVRFPADGSPHICEHLTRVHFNDEKIFRSVRELQKFIFAEWPESYGEQPYFDLLP